MLEKLPGLELEQLYILFTCMWNESLIKTLISNSVHTTRFCYNLKLSGTHKVERLESRTILKIFGSMITKMLQYDSLKLFDYLIRFKYIHAKTNNAVDIYNSAHEAFLE